MSSEPGRTLLADNSPSNNCRSATLSLSSGGSAVADLSSCRIQRSLRWSLVLESDASAEVDTSQGATEFSVFWPSAAKGLLLSVSGSTNLVDSWWAAG